MKTTASLQLLLLLFTICIYAKVHFTNLKCKSVSPDFAQVQHCYLKSANRSFSYLSWRVNLLQVPVSNVTININVLKKANGYKPFLFNVTFDACRFMRIRKKPLINYFSSFVLDYSNFDHRCPMDHDLIVEKLPTSRFDELVTNKLPLPFGDYAVMTSWSAYNVPRATIDIYFSLKEF